MKFHCDRCKTRYSIADERVRGKILKIRCKNCSAVLTVKEGGPVSEPRPARQATSGGAARPSARRRAATNSGSALQGAFEQAIRRPQSMAPADLGGAPAVLDAEWYVSQDGEQFGPYPLPKAQDWVAQRDADEELYCWSEGFDDWLPVEKVSHFRGLRAPAAAVDSGLLSPGVPDGAFPGSPAEAIHPEETPIPLFASTLAQVAADVPADDGKPGPMFGHRNGSSVSQLKNLAGSRPPGPAASSPPTGNSSLFGPLPPAGGKPPGESPADASHDFEIGEASRVVKLPMLARQAGNASRSSPGLPGLAAPAAASDGGLFGRGTGSHGESDAFSPALAGLPVVQGTTVETPRIDAPEPRRRRSGLMMPLAIGTAAVAGVVSVLLYVALTGDGDDAHVRRGQVGGKGGLAYTFEDPAGKKGEGERPADPAAAKNSRRPPRRVTTSRGTTATATAPQSVGPSSDEVDLSGDTPRTGELDPDDLFDVYNANKIGVTMCYNSALKRDPLLNVKRADVLITVSPTGSVSSVSIPSLTGTPLGTCLEKRIRSWKFPKATQVFNSRFPIIFQT